MDEFVILVGGAAGDGIKQSGNMIARLFNRLGYYTFVYEDYPSLIRGGHNFAIIRASKNKVEVHKDKIDILIALNQDAVEFHKWRFKDNTIVIYDSSFVKSEGIGIDMKKIAMEKKLPLIVRNVISLGVLAKILGIEFELVEDVLKTSLKKKIEENIEVAKIGYDSVDSKMKIEKNEKETIPLVTGNEAAALGLVKAGMKLYVAYPMTPASSILHFLAANEDELGVRTVHPENEIAVIGMAQGAAYAGIRSAVGTSGGGFALMTEHLSLSGQGEIPLVIVLSQRAAPATGVPTYTEQGDLFFAMFAGHGEFPRIVLAPGDAEETFYKAGEAMNLAWKFQIPVILLIDKHISESTFPFEVDENMVKPEEPKLWNGEGEYKRYKWEEDGISPLAFPGTPGIVVKMDSYEHDEYGVTTEDPFQVAAGQSKRARKMQTIENYINSLDTVQVFGNPESEIVLVGWGSNKPVVKEVGERLGLKVVYSPYVYPFPNKLKEELSGKKVIVVETNSTGLYAKWLEYNGVRVEHKILRYDARPFSADGLEEEVRKLLG